MTSRSLVSFIMPAWSPDPAWFRSAVRSVLAQIDTELELIIIDDGSPEPVGGILDGVMDPRIKLVRIDHGGVSRARNAGLAVAKGDWVRFVDCDDSLPPTSTRTLLDATSPDFQIAYGATLQCDEALNPRGEMRCTIDGDLLLRAIVGEVDLHLGAFVFGKKIIDRAGLFDPALPLMEDYDFALKTFAVAKARHVKDVVYFYRRHPRSATGTALRSKSHECWSYVLDRFFDRHPQLEKPLRKQVEARALINVAEGYLDEKDVQGAARSLLSAITKAPFRTVQSVPTMLVRLARPRR